MKFTASKLTAFSLPDLPTGRQAAGKFTHSFGQAKERKER